jgi:hypothetical protein
MEQQVYGWVECPSQAVGCTKFLLKISVYLLSEFSYEFYGYAFYSVNENLLCDFIDDLLLHSCSFRML